jgi:hypothetical protein
MLRARLMAASWKVIVLVLLGIIWGASFMLVQVAWPGGAAGLAMAFGLTGVYLALIALVCWLS